MLVKEFFLSIGLSNTIANESEGQFCNVLQTLLEWWCEDRCCQGVAGTDCDSAPMLDSRQGITMSSLDLNTSPKVRWNEWLRLRCLDRQLKWLFIGLYSWVDYKELCKSINTFPRGKALQQIYRFWCTVCLSVYIGGSRAARVVITL